ncbi:MAG: helix-turn-helix domain-containing protein [Lachnospiraceae bacterium]|nr:helix-turn-helix domain-containing protein [Lachnospiraceae bacterium]
MEETLYSVSEAVRLVGVESHVLRYWEEELKIPIQRTSQGHRVYSPKDIEMFCRVREWKQKGLQLKAIRVLLDRPEGIGEEAGFDEQIRSIAYAAPEHSDENKKSAGTEKAHEKFSGADTGTEAFSEAELQDKTAEDGETVYEIVSVQESKGDLEKVILILKQMMEEVVSEQNKKLEREITEQLREEMESLYLQYLQALQEASASREPEYRQGGKLKQVLRRLFPEKR